jgi:hypothetical protein
MNHLYNEKEKLKNEILIVENDKKMIQKWTREQSQIL